METKSDLKPWQCEFCTFMNEPTWLVCGMCFKECEAPNGNGYHFDFPDINADDFTGLDAAPEYSVHPVVAMVSAAATTNASRVCVPSTAVTVASTSCSSFTAAVSVAAPGCCSAGDTAETISYAAATPYTSTAPSAPFSPVSSQNVSSSIRNSLTLNKFTPYAVAPVTTIAAPVNGWARNTNRRLVRVTAPITISSSKTAVTSVDSGVARLRVITPQSNPYYFSNGATIVTSATTYVPSYYPSVRLPLHSRTETPLTFPTNSANTPVAAVSPLFPTSTPILNCNSYNVGVTLGQPSPPATSLNLPSYSGASSVFVHARSTSSTSITSTSQSAGTKLGVSNPLAFPASPVLSSLPNVFQCHPVSQLPTGCTETFHSRPSVTSTLSVVPNIPHVTSASTINGAARVTTAAFADAFATDTTPGWMCSFCTFINDNLLLRCAVCDTEKTQNTSNEPPTPILPPATEYKPDVANDVHFECPLCYLLFAQIEGIVLKNCGHTFCKNCLRNVISYSVQPELKCPFKIKGVSCHKLLTEQEIGFILELEYVAINNSNVITTRPAEQNAVPGPSHQNTPNTSQNDAVPCPSRQNIAAGDFIDLTEDDFKNLPIDTGRNLPTVIGKELNYQELLELEKEVLIPNLENFDCTICMTEQGPGEGVVMRECLHMFCRECLKQAIKCNTDAEMKCPFGDGTTRCDSLLQDREIKALVDANDFEKHLSRSIKEAENKIQNTFHCKTVDCIGWCEYEEEVTQFTCPVCFKANCINCKAIHTGLDCKQYQINVQLNSANNPQDAKTNKMLQSMLQKGTAMNCPKCGIILSKVTGCDWLCCSMCKTEICWVTRGPRWGPKGRGDTTGGCGCQMSRGKRCHPRCGNCH